LAATRSSTVGGIEIRESYGYTVGGRVKWKRTSVNTPVWTSLEASWQWDNEGRMTRVDYPLGARAYTYSYDTMGRLSGMVNAQTSQTVASGAAYNAAGQMTSLSYLGYTETRQYNARLQMTRLTASGTGLLPVDLEYRFSTTANDGRITQMKDWITGEEVSYTYDSLARLSTAATTGPEWGLSFGYDPFGNLTGQTVTKGTAPYMSATYDWATNRRVGATYDANGNEYGPSGYTEYDRENRMTRYDASASYGYNASNQRVYEAVWSGGGVVRDRLTFYGLSGERMATYERTVSPSYTAFAPLWVSVYFGGKLIEQNGQRVVQDRLGSTVVHGSERLGYWPYGQEKPGATTNSRDKFATYWRDATGLDYAMNRYYSGGRFMTPDPYVASSGPAEPASWNRYAYVEGDPVNYWDPGGLCKAEAGTSVCFSTTVTSSSPGYHSSPLGTSVTTTSVTTTSVPPVSQPVSLPGVLTGDSPAGFNLMVDIGDTRYGSGPDPVDSKPSYCSELPEGRTMGLSVSVGIVGGQIAAAEVVINYNSGEVSLFAAGGLQVGFNPGLQGQVYTGMIQNLGPSNSSYAGPFGTLQGGIGPVSGFVSASVQGVQHPFTVNQNAASVIGAGLSLALMNMRFSFGGSLTYFSAPMPLGNLKGIGAAFGECPERR
jgi:RHS repeat-associated protein